MKIERTKWTGVPSLVNCSAARRAAPARPVATSKSAAARYCSARNSRIAAPYGRTTQKEITETLTLLPSVSRLRAGGQPVRELGSRAHTELCISAREVHLDGVHRYVQRRGDLLVRKPLSRKLDHAPFARCQLAVSAPAAADAIELG